MPYQIECSIPATIEGFTQLSAEASEATTGWGLSPAAAYRLEMVLEEMVSNVIKYGFPDGTGAQHTIAVAIRADASAVTVAISDDGIAFNPLEQAQPDIEKSLEEREIGGLGIHMVRETAQEIRYLREGDYNHLTVTLAP